MTTKITPTMVEALGELCTVVRTTCGWAAAREAA